ncbi:MAG TPA: LLM class flavin-dependent oxidoreductase, partial [Acidimicrobiia bacterium]|nr:LLM class flavin-dependent oxidoreductase [Acidimicrobiia bacterium]
MGEVRVGMFPAALRRSWPPVDPSVAEAVDQLCVGNHVSFFVGAGSDGLVSATALRAAQSELPVYVAVYLLALRHRHEIEICGVDPATRGRRMDECLRVLRGLADGSAVTSDGEFFPMRDARILPAPSTKVPLVVGGRSDAAVRRAARFGDGWLGIWVSPLRFAAVRDQIAGEATRMGRDATRFEHALNVWCGFGRSREAARRPLAAQMQAFYQSPFE